MANFPASLHTKLTLLDNVDDVLATHPNTLSDELFETQTKLGIDSSSVNTTIDYFLKHASGSYRTHTHDGSSDDGANIPVANVTLGETTANKENTTLDTSTTKYPTNRLVKEYADTKTTLSAVYPIGSIYVSTVSTNPNTLFGFGTWVAFGEGRVLVGKASSGTFVTAGSTGGEETHTLTTTEMPAHTHGITTGNNFGVGRVPHGDTSATEGHTTNSTGGDGAHNNLQPYIVVYVWNRTA